mmetsp:Transcript_38908/g.115743  ORF Transcript_38908/g.115743 Transcript_38908/m.115743 type:complete len:138 (-) Transcript_38908:2331-2744(-)
MCSCQHIVLPCSFGDLVWGFKSPQTHTGTSPQKFTAHCRCCPKHGHAKPGRRAAPGSSEDTDEVECVFYALEYLLAHKPLASHNCFVKMGKGTPWKLWHVRPMPMQPTSMQAATILLAGTLYWNLSLDSVCRRTYLN